MNPLATERELRRLELVITRRLDGLLHGQYLGLLPGSGTEFAGSREYVPGEDDVRRMEWAVTARTAVPHVRETVADRELSTWVLADATASMDFGTAAVEKRDLAVAAVAAVGFLTAGFGNRLGALVLQGSGVRRFPAGTGRAHLMGVLRTLIAAPRTPPGATSSLAEALAVLNRAARRRGLAVIVSDFLDGSYSDGEMEWAAQLRRLAVRHQVLAVQAIDRREEELPDVGILTLVDPETGRRREISTASRRLRARYATAAAAQQRAVADAIRRSGASHLTLRTDRDWVRDIVRHVLTQRRLAQGVRRELPQS
ncbi:DUF58 domain-containing protein [Allorhizocola rhizosphaerae]|uniref:DUF58 domain-containing protein n=1 Tax=Allorhizocola rhizosphaerae TaxID=1872709 RepID=UPI000E3C0BFE|nr:DUF58 domain-containing protein [Allorhizocola rhizosphaerae]